jgi:CheY-like chemotaxis protein
LTLAKHIAELHQGQIEAASEGSGHGSTFTVTLPRIPDPPEQTRKDDGKPHETVVPRRILLIEDNADARESLRLLLEGSGHQVYEAEDGLRGVKKVLNLKPDVVLIDLGLPGLDGYEVATRIREIPICCSIKLIAITGYAHSEYRARALAVGFQGYLTKPLDTRSLEKAIAGQSV